MAHNNFELKVEVVRFNEKDVIATSGIAPIVSGVMYYTTGSEINQYTGAKYYYGNSDPISDDLTGDKYVVFLDDYNDDDFTIDLNDKDYSSYPYAWYEENGNKGWFYRL